MPNDHSSNFDNNILIGIDGGLGTTSEHFGFGRDPLTNRSTGPRVLNVASNPNGVVSAPAGSIALANDGTGPWTNTTGLAVWVDSGGGGSAPLGAPFLLTAPDAALPNERVFTAGLGVNAVDSGPGAAFTLSASPAYGAATRKFYVDRTIVDSASYAAIGFFATLGSAMTWIEANLAPTVAVEIEFSPVDTVDWHNIDATGWVAGSPRNVTLFGPSGTYTSSSLYIPADVVFPAADPTFPALVFANLNIYLDGDWDTGANRFVLATNCKFSGADTEKMIVEAVVLKNVTDFGIQFVTTFVDDTGGVYDIAKSQILFDGAAPILTNTVINVTATTAGASPKIARTVSGTVAPTLTDVTIHAVVGAAAAATTTLFDLNAASVFSCFDVVLVPSVDTNTLRFAAAANVINTVPGPRGICTYQNTGSGPMILPLGTVWLAPPSGTLDGAAPAFTTLVLVSANGRSRHVFGTVTCASGAGTASAALEVETGVGTNVYARIQTVSAPTGLTIAHAYSICVLPGTRYRFVDLSAGGGVATITDYSFVDNP